MLILFGGRALRHQVQVLWYPCRNHLDNPDQMDASIGDLGETKRKSALGQDDRTLSFDFVFAGKRA